MLRATLALALALVLGFVGCGQSGTEAATGDPVDGPVCLCPTSGPPEAVFDGTVLSVGPRARVRIDRVVGTTHRIQVGDVVETLPETATGDVQAGWRVLGLVDGRLSEPIALQVLVRATGFIACDAPTVPFTAEQALAAMQRPDCPGP
jgi:hypothetical protein